MISHDVAGVAETLSLMTRERVVSIARLRDMAHVLRRLADDVAALETALAPASAPRWPDLEALPPGVISLRRWRQARQTDGGDAA